ncbi:MAG: ATP-binding protein [Acidithiobacillus ferrivorans]
MVKDPWHYPRTALADQYLKTLGIGLSKSLVLFAQRRMGKTEFLRKDLLPAAEMAGYITIYVSLWESREDPKSVLLDAIRKAAEGEGIISGVWRRLSRPESKIGVGTNAGTVGAQASWEQGTAEASDRMLDLRQWMNTLAQKKNPTLLLVDEIQTLADEKRYGALVAALRSALDKHGDQIKAVFTGSSSEGLWRMFQMEKAPFFQFSHQIPFPQLGPEFVQHMLRAFANATQRQLNEAEAWQAFTDLALVPEHFRLMMANMVQLGSTDIATALEEVKTAIQESAE